MLVSMNGSPSAPWITSAPGTDHALYVCSLVLTTEPKHKKPDGENRIVESMFKDEEWYAFYTRIAIIVPVAVQSGIAMAQGIKRLYDTCPCEDLKKLGITLLAHTARYFNIEYLFLSPIWPFNRHLSRELYVAGVPYDAMRYRSLWWALRETEHEENDKGTPSSSWLNIRPTALSFTVKDKYKERTAVVLTITPQACPAKLTETNYTTGEISVYQAQYTTASPSPESRVLLLNEGFYYSSCEEHVHEGYTEPPPLPFIFETHDFLWYIAGDGVMVVHGPSLATLAK